TSAAVQASPSIGQTIPSAIVQVTLSQSSTTPSPIATGDISTCTACDKVKVACGSKFSLPQVNSQGTYIATDKCYCSNDVYSDLSQCLICCNSANVGNSSLDSLNHWKDSCISLGIMIIVRRYRKTRKIGDFPNISKPTKSLDLFDTYDRKSRYSNCSVNKSKENDVAIIPMAVVPEMINIIPEVHILDEASNINLNNNFNDTFSDSFNGNQYYYSSEQQPNPYPHPYV
ncbi:4530_t:CDS:2, partial [Cetraspora pellucida]